MKMINFLLIGLCISLSTFSQAQVGTLKTDPKETSQKFAAAMFYIENFYVDSTKPAKLTEEAIIQTLKSLDPHSAYISKEELSEANEPLEGSFEGIGVTFQLSKDTILVIAPVPGGPSEKLGIQAGDKIVQINGEDAFGPKVNNKFVMDKLRGNKGTSVDVSIYRKGKADLIPYTIVRDKIPLNSIDATFMLNKNVGYIKLNRFSKTTMEEFHASMDQLNKSGMSSLILDLRGNSGGFLGTAVELADEFLGNGKLIVYTEGLNSPRQDFQATQNGGFEKGKLVIMINEGSASASEIVSGAVQDWDRGLILGRRSFGKGLVQRPFNLPDGSIIRLTSARYYTPTGRSIQRPYDDGTDKYFQDIYNRYKNGELVHPDSIHFPDSLKYLTPGKRTVYGGGGIMPDIFVPWDSTQITDYYSNLIRKGVFNRYTIDYVELNRNKIKTEYPFFNNFKKDFKVNAEMMDDFKALAEKEGISFDENQFKTSEQFIRYQIKALIARNIWGMNEYFQVVSDVDDALLRAVDMIASDKSYSQAIKP
ncbi:MAG: S41 family peptidase [Bacteroidetes bacterium]|nr:S41 family peptidase [Bacteroidales bacterium]MBU1011237.1 S41 family peptidase [Bacteroidota bacterium]